MQELYTKYILYTFYTKVLNLGTAYALKASLRAFESGLMYKTEGDYLIKN